MGPPLHVCVVSLQRRRIAFRLAEYPEWVSGFGLPLEDGFGYPKHCAGRILRLGHAVGDSPLLTQKDPYNTWSPS